MEQDLYEIQYRTFTVTPGSPYGIGNRYNNVVAHGSMPYKAFIFNEIHVIITYNEDCGYNWFTGYVNEMADYGCNGWETGRRGEGGYDDYQTCVEAGIDGAIENVYSCCEWYDYPVEYSNMPEDI